MYSLWIWTVLGLWEDVILIFYYFQTFYAPNDSFEKTISSIIADTKAAALHQWQNVMKFFFLLSGTLSIFDSRNYSLPLTYSFKCMNFLVTEYFFHHFPTMGHHKQINITGLCK